MDELKDIIENAITVTEDGQPHVIDIPELKRALLIIADLIALEQSQWQN